MLIAVSTSSTSPSYDQKKGSALIIGLQRIDDEAYWRKHHKRYDSEATEGTHEDMQRMKGMLSSQKYEITELADEQATNKRIFAEMRKISKTLSDNDVFILYFAGHGDEIADKSGDEKSGNDQVFVTYNDYALDDSIHTNLAKYFNKTRNVMVVDACHSSSLYKIYTDFPVSFIMKGNRQVKDFAVETDVVAQSMISLCNYDQENDIDEPYQLIYYGAASDRGLATGISTGGELTRTMKQIFDEAIESGDWASYDYAKYACEISKNIDESQVLQFHEIGPVNPEFIKNQPFKIQL